MPRTVIIGAGLAGLTLAHGLRADGHDVHVFERSVSATHQPASYGIHLNADGLTALHRCLPRRNWDMLDAASTPAPDRVNFRDCMLRPLATLDNENVSAATSPVTRRRAVARGALHQALMTDLGPDVVHWGRTFVGYQTSASGVEAEFGDGSRAQCDVLVGADGCNSRVRAIRLPGVERVDLGITNVAGRVTITPELKGRLPRDLIDGSVNNVVPAGPGWIFVSTWTIDGGTVLVWAWAAANGSYPSDPLHADPKTLLQWVSDRVASWHPGLREVIVATDPATVSAIALKTMPPLQAWRPGRVTLVGDAIHNMTPMAGIGANTALRDAAVLRDCLGEATVDVSTRIGAYEGHMCRYANAALAQSTRNARNAASTNRFSRLTFRGLLKTAEAVPAVKRRVFGRRS